MKLSKIKFPRKIKRMPNGCAAFITQGYRNPSNIANKKYNDLSFNKEQWQATRLSYNLNVTSIPRKPPSQKKGFVLHTCDHGWCIEPDHLYLGTQKQNINDLYSRHKTIHSIRTKSMKNNKHALGHRWKLTDATKKMISKAKIKYWKERKCHDRVSI